MLAITFSGDEAHDPCPAQLPLEPQLLALLPPLALAMALFWAMSAGFVRGVGFVPRLWVWRALFSGWSCAAALLLAAVLKLQH